MHGKTAYNRPGSSGPFSNSTYSRSFSAPNSPFIDINKLITSYIHVGFDFVIIKDGGSTYSYY